MIQAGLFNFVVALTTGLVAATLVPAIRRELPRRLELTIWVVFVFTCAMACLNVRDPRARVLAEDLSWAGGQIVRSTAAISLEASVNWLASRPLLVLAVCVVTFGLAFAAGRSLGMLVEAQVWYQRLLITVEAWVIDRVDTWNGVRVAASTLAPGIEDARHRAAAGTSQALGKAAVASANTLTRAGKVSALALGQAGKVGAETLGHASSEAAQAWTGTVSPWGAKQVRRLADTVLPVASAAVSYTVETYRTQNPIVLPNAFLMLEPHMPSETTDESDEQLAS